MRLANGQRRWLQPVIAMLVAGFFISAALGTETAKGELPVDLGKNDPALKNESTGELELRATSALQTLDFGGALPVLEELARRLGPSPDQEIAERLQRIWFFLGTSYLNIAEYSSAASVLEHYLRVAYERQPVQARDGEGRREIALAWELLGDARFGEGNYAWASVAYEEARDAYSDGIDETEEKNLFTKLSASYVRAAEKAGKWERTLIRLRSLLEDAENQAARENVLVAMCKALIRSGQEKQVEKLQPALEKIQPAARRQFGFNQLLFDTAEKMRAAGKLKLALFFYEFAISKEEIVAGQTKAIEALREKSDALKAKQAPLHERLAVAYEYQSAKERLEAVVRSPIDYDELRKVGIAQTLYDLARYAEAAETFWAIYREDEKGEYANEACYRAFSAADKSGSDKIAIAAGKEYLEKYEQPAGRWGETARRLGAIYARRGEHQKAIDLQEMLLERAPEHEAAPDLQLQKGYSLLQTRDFDGAREVFKTVAADFAESDAAASAQFWHAMTEFEAGEYTVAAKQFGQFQIDHPDHEKTAEAHFREGLAQYSAENYRGASKTFESILVRYPDDPKRAEVMALLGECYGATGAMTRAIMNFREAALLSHDDELADHAWFKAGEAMAAHEDYLQMAEWFEKYVLEYRDRPRSAAALEKQAQALEKLGRETDARAVRWEAIQRWGNERAAETVPETLVIYLRSQGTDGVKKLQESARTANDRGERLRYLRLVYALEQVGETDFPVTESDQDFELGCPLVVIWLSEKLLEQDQGQDALKQLHAAIQGFEKSTYRSDLYFALGRTQLREKKFAAAEKSLLQVREISPQKVMAGEATRLRAEALWKAGRTGEAIEELESLLAVREWRGKLWAEALLMLGDIFYGKEKFERAFAYYQRIYILYAEYSEITAKAYLRASECSVKLGLTGDAIRQLMEMQSKSELAEHREYELGQERLEALLN